MEIYYYNKTLNVVIRFGIYDWISADMEIGKHSKL